MAEMFSGLHEGQRFASLEEFKTSLRALSVRQHWDLRMVRSNKKNVSVGCRSAPDCPFRVICRSNKNATHITNLNDAHTCRRGPADSATQSARSEVSHVRFLLEEVPKLFDMREKIMGQQIVDAVKRYHGYDISIRQAQRVLTKLQPRYRTRKVRPDQIHQERDSPRHEVQDQHPGYEEPATQPEYRGLEDNRGEWLPDQEFHPELLAESLNPGNNSQEPSEHHSYTAMATQPTSRSAEHNPNNVSYAQHHEQGGLNESLYATHNVHQTSNDPVYQSNTSQPSDNTHSQNMHHIQPPKPSDESINNQLLLTNFKIEFKCTSCGAFNRSYLPNQSHPSASHVPDGHNVPSHSIGPG
ncbi:hypothetical protein FQN54_000840 [Arachnomyces sp. PD_36]|nr:hypothetical protein FQN54_000840 [Arachnomyces sp. PD_36]